MITLDVKTGLICLALLVLVVLLIILCILGKHLIVTVKNLNNILEDTNVVSKIASDKAVKVDGIVGDISGMTRGLSDAVSGNAGFISAISNVAKAAVATSAYFRNSDPARGFEAAERKKWKSRRF